MTPDELADAFAVRVVGRLAREILERVGTLMTDDMEAVTFSVVRAECLQELATPDEATRAVVEGFAAGVRADRALE